MCTATDGILVVFCLPCNHYQVGRDQLPVLFGREWSSVLMSCHLLNPWFSPSVRSLLTLTTSTISPLPFLLCMALVYVLSQLFLNLGVSSEIEVRFMQLCCIKIRPWITPCWTPGRWVSRKPHDYQWDFWIFRLKYCISHMFSHSVLFLTKTSEFLQYDIEASSNKLLPGNVFQHDRRT